VYVSKDTVPPGISCVFSQLLPLPATDRYHRVAQGPDPNWPSSEGGSGLQHTALHCARQPGITAAEDFHLQEFQHL